jgi:hypothetical protein
LESFSGRAVVALKSLGAKQVFLREALKSLQYICENDNKNRPSDALIFENCGGPLEKLVKVCFNHYAT